jgi:effector-binding domain-containing protein
MTYVVSCDLAHAVSIAAVRSTTRWPDIGATIRSSLDEVWAHLRANPPGAIRHNVVVYINDTPDVEIGVQVAEPFVPSDRVRLFTLPAGPVAHTLHVGPYRTLGAAHEVVIKQCKEWGVPSRELVGRSMAIGQTRKIFSGPRSSTFSRHPRSTALPNPRLQRTRPASPLSPLSRKPLGGE